MLYASHIVTNACTRGAGPKIECIWSGDRSSASLEIEIFIASTRSVSSMLCVWFLFGEKRKMGSGPRCDSPAIRIRQSCGTKPGGLVSPREDTGSPSIGDGSGDESDQHTTHCVSAEAGELVLVLSAHCISECDRMGFAARASARSHGPAA